MAGRLVSAEHLVVLAVTILVASHAQAQAPIVREQVDLLVKQLDANKGDARTEAEKALVEMGPKILPMLPDPDRLKSAEQKVRVERIRDALAAVEEEARLNASLVTIQGRTLPLAEALKQLRQQSGNAVTDLREQMGEDVTNPNLDLNIDQKTFLEALDIICEKAGLVPNFYTGDGTVGLVTASTPPGSKVVYHGPFRVQFKQLVFSRDFGLNRTLGNAQFDLAWEPRFRPLFLAIKSSDITIRDDQGKPITPSVPEESFRIVIHPENPAAELNLNLVPPDRRAQLLSVLKVKAEVTLPAGLRTFTFPQLDRGGKQVKDKVTVALEPLRIEEHIWKLRVNLDYPDGGPAFESFQMGLMNNRLWLVGPGDKRIEHNGPNGGGFNTLGSDGGHLAFEYLFVDIPGKPSEYSFVYEAPSRMIAMPVEFEFTDVPLP